MKLENISIQNGIRHVYRQCPTCGEWGWVIDRDGQDGTCVFCRKEAANGRKN